MTSLNLESMSRAELLDIKKNVEARLAAMGEATVGREFRVTVEIGAVSRWKYRKPWIGRVTTWPAGERTALKFGAYLGDHEGGELEIAARAGDIIRWGHPKRSNYWAQVLEDGTLERLSGAEARRLWEARNA